MAIINCPECGKEVSDTASCCLAVFAVAAILIFTIFSLNRGIVGTWEIDHYYLDGEKISTDHIDDYFGSGFENL